ncbi:MAG TPA: hypothetical protein VK502_00215 [Candidatus Saccharimonadales bacterium]|nr:hypothetical protein [Candidatus Saccharimonadales bacterium]
MTRPSYGMGVMMTETPSAEVLAAAQAIAKKNLQEDHDRLGSALRQIGQTGDRQVDETSETPQPK